MIYECPNCQTPQEAGQTICPHCHAEFDGPVPSDAIVPPADIISPADIVSPADAVVTSPVLEETAVPEEASASPGAATPPTDEAVLPLTEEAVLPPSETILPPPETTVAPSTLVEVAPAASAPAFPPAQAYTPPADFSQPPLPPGTPFGRLSRMLLIAFPVVLVLVLAGVFYTNSLNSDADPAPMPLPAVHSAPAAPPSAAPVTSPTYLQGGSNINSAADDPRAKLLAGRWESKSGDYYVFSSDGTGSRGNPVNQQAEQKFLWGLVQNRLMLYMDKNEMLRFNAGPDDNTIFLGGQTGSYVQYSRSKTT